MGSHEFSFSMLWLGYCAFVIDCLMQLLSYLLCMEREFNNFHIGK